MLSTGLHDDDLAETHWSLSQESMCRISGGRRWRIQVLLMDLWLFLRQDSFICICSTITNL